MLTLDPFLHQRNQPVNMGPAEKGSAPGGIPSHGRGSDSPSENSSASPSLEGSS